MNDYLLRHATQTINTGSKSFTVAARLFAPDVRRGVLMLYTWCRRCDDVVDGQEFGFGALHPTEYSATENLAALELQTQRAYAGEVMHDAPFTAFQEVARRYEIAPQFAFDHLAGFAMDVNDAQYETLEDTLRYCYHVAGVVGLMMAKIMGASGEVTLDRACDLGIAFQLTNIARDIVEDAAVGRCYLPKSYLRDAGLVHLKTTDLALPHYRAQLAQVAVRLINDAEPYYASAQIGIAALPLRSAWAIATAHGVYRQIGIEVKRRGAHAWDTRVSTSRTRKVLLLIKGAAMAIRSRLQRFAPRPTSLWQRPIASGANEQPNHLQQPQQHQSAIAA
jgi:15-cis-phytoene synthase